MNTYEFNNLKKAIEFANVNRGNITEDVANMLHSLNKGDVINMRVNIPEKGDEDWYGSLVMPYIVNKGTRDERVLTKQVILECNTPEPIDGFSVEAYASHWFYVDEEDNWYLPSQMGA